MALFFHVTTTNGNTITAQVPEGWMPSIMGGVLELPGHAEGIVAGAIASSRFESRRLTPKLDGLKAAVAEAEKLAQDALLSLYKEAQGSMAMEEPGPSFRDLAHYYYSCEKTAQEERLRLSAYELAMHKARNAERKPRKKAEAPATPAPAPKKKTKKSA